MNTPPLERYLRKWRLSLDGPLLETPIQAGSMPVRHLGRPADAQDAEADQR